MPRYYPRYVFSFYCPICGREYETNPTVDLWSNIVQHLEKHDFKVKVLKKYEYKRGKGWVEVEGDR
jgi:hypothetical protein